MHRYSGSSKANIKHTERASERGREGERSSYRPPNERVLQYLEVTHLHHSQVSQHIEKVFRSSTWQPPWQPQPWEQRNPEHPESQNHLVHLVTCILTSIYLKPRHDDRHRHLHIGRAARAASQARAVEDLVWFGLFIVPVPVPGCFNYEMTSNVLYRRGLPVSLQIVPCVNFTGNMDTPGSLAPS